MFNNPRQFAPNLFAPHGQAKARYALIISGDGMLTTLADGVALKMSQSGIASGRIKSLNYFWSRRSPSRMAHDLERHLRGWLARHEDDRFILIGYSFGAGTLPFAVNRLPKDIAAKIDGVALLAAPATADFEFFFRSWLNHSTADALPTAPEIEKLSMTCSVLYMRGVDDFVGPSDQLIATESLTIEYLDGGHDFNKDYEGLARRIIDAFPNNMSEITPHSHTHHNPSV